MRLALSPSSNVEGCIKDVGFLQLVPQLHLGMRIWFSTLFSSSSSSSCCLLNSLYSLWYLWIDKVVIKKLLVLGAKKFLSHRSSQRLLVIMVTSSCSTLYIGVDLTQRSIVALDVLPGWDRNVPNSNCSYTKKRGGRQDAPKPGPDTSWTSGLFSNKVS